jgi:hypothetical protein
MSLSNTPGGDRELYRPLLAIDLLGLTALARQGRDSQMMTLRQK